jgi:hypothetical protein
MSSLSLPDSLSIGAILFAGISGCMVFIKAIKRCRISRKGFELEREPEKEKDIVNQQEFMLNLIKVVQKENLQHPIIKSPRRCASDDSLPWNKSSIALAHKQPMPIRILAPERNPKLHPEDIPSSSGNEGRKSSIPLHSYFIVKKK